MPPRPTSIGTAGRLKSEWVADIRPESPADFVGMRRLAMGRRVDATIPHLHKAAFRCRSAMQVIVLQLPTRTDQPGSREIVLWLTL